MLLLFLFASARRPKLLIAKIYVRMIAKSRPVVTEVLELSQKIWAARWREVWSMAGNHRKVGGADSWRWAFRFRS